MQLVPVARSRSSTTTPGTPIATRSSCPTFAEHCLRHGVQAVCVTLDERGCVAYRLDESGGLVEQEMPRILVETSSTRPVPATRSPRGWRSVTCRTTTSSGAAQYGNAMGAQRCTRLGAWTSTSRCRRPTSSSPRTYGAALRVTYRTLARTTTREVRPP